MLPIIALLLAEAVHQTAKPIPAKARKVPAAAAKPAAHPLQRLLHQARRLIRLPKIDVNLNQKRPAEGRFWFKTMLRGELRNRNLLNWQTNIELAARAFFFIIS